MNETQLQVYTADQQVSLDEYLPFETLVF
jgi:hypothetical protein